jgi:hypothetical protein
VYGGEVSSYFPLCRVWGGLPIGLLTRFSSTAMYLLYSGSVDDFRFDTLLYLYSTYTLFSISISTPRYFGRVYELQSLNPQDASWRASARGRHQSRACPASTSTRLAERMKPRSCQIASPRP